MTTQTPATPRPTECPQCAAPAGIHATFCETAISRLLDCLDQRHAFMNTAPVGEKPLWKCKHCGEPRITPTEHPANTATGLLFAPARNGGEAA